MLTLPAVCISQIMTVSPDRLRQVHLHPDRSLRAPARVRRPGPTTAIRSLKVMLCSLTPVTAELFFSFTSPQKVSAYQTGGLLSV